MDAGDGVGVERLGCTPSPVFLRKVIKTKALSRELGQGYYSVGLSSIFVLLKYGTPGSPRRSSLTSTVS